LEEQSRNLDEEIEKLAKLEDDLRIQVYKKINRIGNIVHPSVPISKDEVTSNKTKQNKHSIIKIKLTTATKTTTRNTFCV
jgi:seryl-tRNA synthetase